ncbi:Thioredoxin [hydrothermal vent metagenome]|uniref:Thioredoxin n=1 Tax=hydrothermal vent metagenome TaxID=652676 RepID=A0A1W1CRY8_9ZZZZ
MDPHCGWCYGNHKNFDEIYDKSKEKVNFELLVGGMWLKKDAPKGGKELLNFIKAHTEKIVKQTGVNISNKYYDLALDESYTFSSLEPSAAIILLKEIAPKKVFEFTYELQKSIFIDGKKSDIFSTYESILEELNINSKNFKKQWLSADNIKKTQDEFIRVEKISYGYPSLFIEKDGKTRVIAAGKFDVTKTIEIINKELK